MNTPHLLSKIFKLTFCVLAAASVHTASAQVIVSQSTVEPSSDLLIRPQNVAGTGGIGWQWSTSSPTSDRRDLLQQFHYASDFEINKISLFTSGGYTIASGESVGFSITFYSYASSSSTTPVSTVASYTGELTRNGSGNRWWTFDIPDTQFSADTVYGFVLSFTESLANNSITWQTLNGASYPGASFAYTGYATGVPVTMLPGGALNFIIQGTAIPEPSIAFLMIVPCAAFAFRRFVSSHS